MFNHTFNKTLNFVKSVKDKIKNNEIKYIVRKYDDPLCGLNRILFLDNFNRVVHADILWTNNETKVKNMINDALN